MTIGIFALLAQQERELISERTKKALQAKKAKGYKIKLGSPQNLTSLSREKARIEFYQRWSPPSNHKTSPNKLFQPMT
jgi:DNA invertase Pin-like site-specific DNA recombinase